MMGLATSLAPTGSVDPVCRALGIPRASFYRHRRPETTTELDEGIYLASEHTFYRVLPAQGETTERRNQLTHPTYHKPKLLAVRPNQVWSWDITKLLGPTRWIYFCLYVIIDIFSRGPKGTPVSWTVAHQELATLAERLIADTLAKDGNAAKQLTIHMDRGSAMTSEPVAL